MSFFGNYNEHFTIVDTDGVILASPGDEQAIEEPKELGAIGIRKKRDVRYMSFFREAGDSDEVDLLLTRNRVSGETYSGFSFLKELFETVGVDFKAYLRAYRTPTGGSEEFREWKISSYSEDDIEILIRIKRVFYDDKLRTRIDAGVNVESTTDLDGAANSALSLIEVPFHSERIDQELNIAVAGKAGYSSEHGASFDTDQTTYFSIDLGETLTETIDGYTRAVNAPYEEGFTEDDFLLNDISPTIKFERSGEITIDPNVYVSYFANRNFSGTHEGTYDVSLRYKLYGNAGEKDSGTFGTDSGSFNQSIAFGGNNIFTLNKTIDVAKGDLLFIYVRFEYSSDTSDHDGLRIGTSFNTPDPSIIDMSFESYSEPSVVEGALIKTTLNKILDKITGESVTISSTFLDGEEGNNFITSGNKLRGNTDDLICSSRKILDFLRVRYGVGFAIIDTGSGIEVVIEKAEEFFADVEILELTNVKDVVEIKPNEDLIFNEWEVGYNKFAKDNEKGGSKGFNTKRTYLSPITSRKKKLALLADVITDGHEIERMRGIEPKENDSDQSDEEIFIVKLQEFNSSNPLLTASIPNSSIEVDGLTITLHGIYLEGQIESATTFYFSEMGGNPAESIDSIDFDAVLNQTVLTMDSSNPVSDATYTGQSFYFNIDVLVPERRERFSGISGVDDQYTTYNLVHAPSNFVFENFPYYGGSFFGKATSDKMIVTDRKNSILLNRNYLSSSDIGTTAQVMESENLSMLRLRNAQSPLLGHRWFKVTALMNYDDEFKDLDDSLNGEHATTSFGYIVTDDNDGNEVELFPVEVEYNLDSTEVDLICWEKA